MKIALVCQSLLLARALKSFLKDNIVPYKQCDFVISDKKIELDKPIFFISTNKDANLSMPFSKTSLLLSTETFYQQIVAPEPSACRDLPERDVLEEKIASLTEKFRQELIQTLRSYYGN